MSTEAPFDVWGIDFIGEFQEKSSAEHSWILVATDYFTKWIEDIPTRKETSRVVTEFLLENILTRFGVPNKLIMDNAMSFRSK